eukprot:340470-Amphidinium_carterae.1
MHHTAQTNKTFVVWNAGIVEMFNAIIHSIKTCYDMFNPCSCERCELVVRACVRAMFGSGIGAHGQDTFCMFGSGICDCKCAHACCTHRFARAVALQQVSMHRVLSGL